MDENLDYGDFAYISEALEIKKKLIENIKESDEGNIGYKNQELGKIRELQKKISQLQSKWLAENVPNTGNHLNYTDE